MKKKISMSFCLIWMVAVSNFAFAVTRQVPLLFNYQSVLTDEGGNLLPDGYQNLKFEILNSVGDILYEESQDVEIVKGNVSAIVGNGSNDSGAPTGGISADVLDPTDIRYLRVTAGAQKAYDPMELVTVPYSMWANVALSMPSGSITSDMIGKGVVNKDHLDKELFATIFPDGLPKSMLPSDTVYGDKFQSFQDVIQSTNGASKVGVTTAFVYSGSQTVQGVLKDLDIAIKKRQEDSEYYNSAEVKSRNEADTNHAKSTTTHGVFGSIVGTENSQTLTNKIYSGTLSNTSGNHSGTWQSLNAGNGVGNVPINNGETNVNLRAALADSAANLTTSILDKPLTEIFDVEDETTPIRAQTVYKATTDFANIVGGATKYAVSMLGVTGNLSPQGDINIKLDKDMMIVGSNLWFSGDGNVYTPGTYAPGDFGSYTYNKATGEFMWYSNCDDYGGWSYNLVIFYLAGVPK